MSPIQDFALVYEALNNSGTFSEGDPIIGTLTFKLKKDTKVKNVFLKAKGEAHVHWTEGSGDNERSYSAHTRFFKVKEYLVAEKDEGNKLHQGVHHFNFSLTIPKGDFPSSFKGHHGHIVYMLEAKISRSWRMPTTLQKQINFVSKSFPHTDQAMCPQSSSVNKEMGGFSKGEVQMSATVNRKACSPGDTLSIFAQICNSSSKKIRPKFSLEQRTVYRAGTSTTSTVQTLFKMVGDTIGQTPEETASCKLTIPIDAIYTLHNCDILSVEYYIKVYLDIKFAIDPEVVFPLVVTPSSSFVSCEDVQPFPAGAFGVPSYSDFPAPVFPVELNPLPTGSGYPAPDATQLENITSGNNYQWPQNAPPYGASSHAAFVPPSVQHSAPAIPPQYQQGEQPPSYTFPCA
ncbi:arrestin domain-containing protein 3-like [Odontesthes bonariensis]|uniref:arrestin domain-containing protein 3-like n=1 Tax=Odontesthes bonariensis TaxID=219752 RepID=UPI003F58DAA9